VPGFINRFFREESGFTFFMCTVGIIALLGFTALVTDFGRISMARQRLVNAVDSGAMAAAQDLIHISDSYNRELEACQRAVDVAVANGVPSDGISVNIDGNNISVDAEITVELILSRIFGVKQRTIRAHATAAAGSVSSYTGIAPLTIYDQPLVYGQLYTIKYGSPTSPGNFGALALGGTGASTYKDNLIYGYDNKVRIGDRLKTKPGNMSGPTEGIDQRLARCTDGCTFDSFKPNCPRIIVIPIHRDEDLHGRDEITVTGFAAFFVDRENNNSDKDEIKGYFVRMAAEGDPDFLQPVTSLYGVKLIE